MSAVFQYSYIYLYRIILNNLQKRSPIVILYLSLHILFIISFINAFKYLPLRSLSEEDY